MDHSGNDVHNRENEIYVLAEVGAVHGSERRHFQHLERPGGIVPARPR